MPTLLYNTLIRAHLGFGQPRKTLLLFIHMLAHQAPPNSHTFPPLIKAAAATSSSSSSPHLGSPLHTQVVKRGVLRDPFIQTSFVSFYAELGKLCDARKVFEEMSEPCVVACNAMIDGFGKNGDMGSAVLLFESMPERDVVSWTSVINGFGRNGCFSEGIRFFQIMMNHENVMGCFVKPNEATYVSVLSSCANLGGWGSIYWGKQIHGHVIRNGIELTAFLGTALVDLYGKTGCLNSAGYMYQQVVVKEVCTWNAMISALSLNGKEKEALDLFEKMKMERLQPNEVTFVAVLTACARGKLVKFGLELFRSMTNDFGVEPIMEHYGCVVDLLGRAGLFWEATEVIKSMPFEPDASVLGNLEWLLLQVRLQYWHTYFDAQFESSRGIAIGLSNTSPMMHSVRDCVIRLGGKYCFVAILLSQAKNLEWLLLQVRLQGALLGSCKIHGTAELGNEVGEKLLELQPQHCGRYVVLSNINAGKERWDLAAAVRKTMVDAGIRKIPAYSMIEVK
ncbi:unnamed protein product [Malus baccata var. baccata]